MKVNLRTVLSVFLVIAILVVYGAFVPGGAFASPPLPTYNISTADELVQFANKGDISGGWCNLNADIDLSGINWTPIGTKEHPFTGTFNGNGYEIKNLTINSTSEYVGLFGYSSGTIEHVGITGNSSVEYAGGVTTACIGSIVGYNAGTVQYCYNTSEVKSYYTGNCGGIVGSNDGTVEQCYNKGNLTGVGNLGGIVGYNTNDILDCYNIGSIAGAGCAGGIVGFNKDTGSITSCYNAGDFNISPDYHDPDNPDGPVPVNLYGPIAGNFGAVDFCFYLNLDDNLWYDSNEVALGRALTADDLKGELSVSAFTDDVINVNNGYPILSWQACKVTFANAENGTVTVKCGENSVSNGEYLPLDSNIVISATPNEGYSLVKVTIDNSEVKNGSTYNVTDDITISATFTPNLGSGTEDDPYLIKTAEDLQLIEYHSYIGDDFDGKFIKLANDIDLANISWIPIGSEETPFKGNFDGGGYKIQNINVKPSMDYAGLFGYSSGNIKNLGIENENLVDYTYYNTTGLYYNTIAGGIVGHNSGNVKNCYNVGSIPSNAISTGGIAGENYGSVKDCYNIGVIHYEVSPDFFLSTRIGGIVAENRDGGSIENCYNTGRVLGDVVGGISGLNTGSIGSCYNTGNISGGVVGGISGENTKSVVGCYNFGNVWGVDVVGGIIGDNSGVVKSCYSCGTVRIALSSSGLNLGISFGKNSGENSNVYYLKDSKWYLYADGTNDTILDGNLTADIVNGGGNYFKDSNNGYPILSWQACKVMMSVSALDWTHTVVNVSVNLNNTTDSSANGTLFLSVYENGVLRNVVKSDEAIPMGVSNIEKSIQYLDIGPGEGEIDAIRNFTVKAFLWNDTTSIEPISDYAQTAFSR